MALRLNSGCWMQVVMLTGVTLACLVGPARAAVESVGSITPVPPSGGGTFAAQLVVGDEQSASSDVRAWLQIDDGSVLQYGSLIVGDEESFVGEVNVLGNFLGPQGSPYTEFRLTGNTQIGQQGFGRLNLNGGATMASNTLSIGVDAIGVGSVSVSDPFTILTFNTDLHVGQSGIGQLEINDGAWVQPASSSSTAHIGTNATGVGTVLVDGNGSVLRYGRNLRVGENGEGTLIVGDGALVVAENTTTANNTITVSRLGRVEMHGGTLSGSKPAAATEFGATVDGYLGGTGLVRSSVAFNGAASLEVGAGDVLRFDGKVDNQGAITVAGGELRFLDDFSNKPRTADVNGNTVTPPGRITLQDATIRFSKPLTGDFANQGVITSAIAAENTDGQITTNHFHGQITNASEGTILVASDTVAIFHDAVTNSGAIELQERASALFLADLKFESGPLVLPIGPAPLAGSSAQIAAAGALTLGGDLIVSIEDGYTPALGDRFELLTADGGLVGTFNSATLPDIPDNLEFELLYGPTSVMIEARVAGLPGDYNSDGIVDAADYVVWRDQVGSSTSLANDDTPGVGQDDYDRWKANFGRAGDVVGGLALGMHPAIPEPTTALLVLVAAFSWALGRRR